jgi:uncharacterized membrane protein YfcA
MTVASVEALIRREPVLVIGVGLAVAVMMIIAFVPHLTPTEVAAVSTIVTAVTAIISAFLVKPANVAVISAAISTGLVAAAAFGLHLSPAVIATVASTVVAVLGYLLREKVSPVVGTKPNPDRAPH